MNLLIARLFAAASISTLASAAEDFGKAEPFMAGDTMCFVGDSITHGGTYHSIVTLYYATRFPDRTLRTFNCGIGGDRASGIMSDEKYRLNVDILGHKPTVATIMLGMNDIGHTDYYVPGKDAPDAEKKRARSLEVYSGSMQKLIGALKKTGARIILITPSIYDETTKLESARKEVALGANGALGKCAVSNIQTSATGVSFDCTEKALPLVLPEEARAALRLVPFTKELNVEKLRVTGLPNGNYELKIDDRSIGDYSSGDLQAGVNLAENSKTPQYEQSAAATKINNERTATGSKLRGLASQLYGMSKGRMDVTDAAAVEKSLTARLEASSSDGKPAGARLKAALDTFRKRDELTREYDTLAAKLYEACQPKPHHFTLTKK